MLAGSWYFLDVLSSHKNFEVTVDRGDTAVTLSSEEAIKERITSDEPVAALPPLDQEQVQPFTLTLENASGVTGAGARIALDLEAQGYVVSGIALEDDHRLHSSIVYDASLEDVAIKLSQYLGGVLTSVRPKEEYTGTPHLYLIIGEDIGKEAE
jgi:hypothetical protein